MQIKVYVPRVVDVPNEYLAALAKRAHDKLGERSREIAATRGHLLRQAVRDGLVRELDELVDEDGNVDLVCDPGAETPLEVEGKQLSLAELREALQSKRAWHDVKPPHAA
ncbi:MAG: hypothetical protein K2Y37_14255 [Pirellulales bacterium]|nr:hypothetical protein [Pirellulales bacterium]